MATAKKKEAVKVVDTKSVMKKKEVKVKVASFMAIKQANEIEHLITADDLGTNGNVAAKIGHQYVANLRTMHNVKSYSVQKLLNAVSDKTVFTSSLEEKIHKLYLVALNAELKKRKIS
jgi:hypothetical protein